jgi:hypothetical protein
MKQLTQSIYLFKLGRCFARVTAGPRPLEFFEDIGPTITALGLCTVPVHHGLDGSVRRLPYPSPFEHFPWLK